MLLLRPLRLVMQALRWLLAVRLILPVFQTKAERGIAPSRSNVAVTRRPALRLAHLFFERGPEKRYAEDDEKRGQ